MNLSNALLMLFQQVFLMTPLVWSSNALLTEVLSPHVLHDCCSPTHSRPPMLLCPPVCIASGDNVHFPVCSVHVQECLWSINSLLALKQRREEFPCSHVFNGFKTINHHPDPVLCCHANAPMHQKSDSAFLLTVRWSWICSGNGTAVCFLWSQKNCPGIAHAVITSKVIL